MKSSTNFSKTILKENLCLYHKALIWVSISGSPQEATSDRYYTIPFVQRWLWYQREAFLSCSLMHLFEQLQYTLRLKQDCDLEIGAINVIFASLFLTCVRILPTRLHRRLAYPLSSSPWWTNLFLSLGPWVGFFAERQTDLLGGFGLIFLNTLMHSIWPVPHHTWFLICCEVQSPSNMCAFKCYIAIKTPWSYVSVCRKTNLIPRLFKIEILYSFLYIMM